MIDKVNSAIHNKTGLSMLTDRVATYFTYVILLTVFSVLALSPVLGITNAFDRVLALLVLSCPCALAIATPLAFSLAIKRAFNNGLLIKKADVFERSRGLTAIGFDKTGTLTTGVAKVTAWLPHRPDREQMAILGSLEKDSAHPIAKAIIADIGPFEVIEFDSKQEIAGMGVRAELNSATYSLFKSDQSEQSEVIFAKRAPSNFA